MKQKLLDLLKPLLHQRKRRVYIFAGLVTIVLLPLCLAMFAYSAVRPYGKYVLPDNTPQHVRVGMVLGAGITDDGKPFKELRARLDVAASALKTGKIDKLILSGDNRFKKYDEPTAMVNYLVNQKGISKDKLQPDFAGRSTYESCDRAANVFGLKKLMLFSVQSHLPRAIYLCRSFGIETYGMASHIEANNQIRREVMARVKALLNVHVWGDPTILGDRITL